MAPVEPSVNLASQTPVQESRLITLTERRKPQRSARSRSVSPGPVHRTIIAVDIEKSTLRTNPEKEALRRRIYLLLDEAMRQAGIEERHLERLMDRGDGVLALIRPADEIPKTVLLQSFVPTLVALLKELGGDVSVGRQQPLRLRLVIHAGEIHDDGWGFFGEDLDIAFRLLDAPRVKAALNRAQGPMVLVVSEMIYQSIIRHGYDAIDATAYARVVRVRVGNRDHLGHLCTPG